MRHRVAVAGTQRINRRNRDPVGRVSLAKHFARRDIAGREYDAAPGIEDLRGIVPFRFDSAAPSVFDDEPRGLVLQLKSNAATPAMPGERVDISPRARQHVVEARYGLWWVRERTVKRKPEPDQPVERLIRAGDQEPSQRFVVARSVVAENIVDGVEIGLGIVVDAGAALEVRAGRGEGPNRDRGRTAKHAPFLEQYDGRAAARGFERRSESGPAAPDHDDIERVGVVQGTCTQTKAATRTIAVAGLLAGIARIPAIAPLGSTVIPTSSIC